MMPYPISGRVMLALFVLLSPGPARAQDPPAAVPVRRVMLFSSGVGYFEHAGAVTDTTRTELRFKAEQINDLLKSLVLEDLDGGTIRRVEYPSQDPLEKTLATFGVDIGDNPPLAELLNRMRGSAVHVATLGRTLEGHVLGVEHRRQALPHHDGPIDRWLLNLMNADRITTVPLSDIQDLRLDDAALQSELLQALRTLAHARDQSHKPLTVHFEGQGRRRVRLAYVVETPVWKTSYRLVLASGDAEAHLQGWAIVENQTDSDWDGIELGLISGRPISFSQDLYQPLYVPRPVVRPEILAGLAPRQDTGLLQASDDFEFSMATAFAFAGSGTQASSSQTGLLTSLTLGGPAMDPRASVQAASRAADLGELFSYTVPAVSLPRQRSAMIPIVADPVGIERLSVYNQAVLARHPLNAVRLTNTTGKHLLQGPITVFDGGGYAGDARLDDLPPDQQRLLTYAVDLDVRIQVDANSTPRRLLSGTVVRGVLELRSKDVHEHTYRLYNHGDRERHVVIEHPLREGWTISQPTTPGERTADVVRYEIALDAGESRPIVVVEDRVTKESLALLNTDVTRFVAQAEGGAFSDAVRQSLVEVVTAKQALHDVKLEMDDLQAQIRQIVAEQERIRSNMGRVDTQTDYYQRLLMKLDTQESEIETLQNEILDLDALHAERRSALEQRLAEMTIE